MNIHTTDADVDGLRLSSGTFIPVLDLEVSLNVRSLALSTKNGKLDIESLSASDKAEIYDYMLCRWLAAKNATVREMWSEVGSHA
jgi:hypothetical protein